MTEGGGRGVSHWTLPQVVAFSLSLCHSFWQVFTLMDTLLVIKKTKQNKTKTIKSNHLWPSFNKIAFAVLWNVMPLKSHRNKNYHYSFQHCKCIHDLLLWAIFLWKILWEMDICFVLFCLLCCVCFFFSNFRRIEMMQDKKTKQNTHLVVINEGGPL